MILPTFSFPETFSFLTSSLIATPVEHLAHLHFVTASSNVLGKPPKTLWVHAASWNWRIFTLILCWSWLSQACLCVETEEAAMEGYKAWAKKPKATFSQNNAYHDDQKICVCVFGSSLTKKHIISIMIMTIIPSYQHILPASLLVWIPWLGCFEGLSPNMFVAI